METREKLRLINKGNENEDYILPSFKFGMSGSSNDKTTYMKVQTIIPIKFNIIFTCQGKEKRGIRIQSLANAPSLDRIANLGVKSKVKYYIGFF